MIALGEVGQGRKDTLHVNDDSFDRTVKTANSCWWKLPAILTPCRMVTSLPVQQIPTRLILQPDLCRKRFHLGSSEAKTPFRRLGSCPCKTYSPCYFNNSKVGFDLTRYRCSEQDIAEFRSDVGSSPTIRQGFLIARLIILSHQPYTPYEWHA